MIISIIVVSSSSSSNVVIIISSSSIFDSGLPPQQARCPEPACDVSLNYIAICVYIYNITKTIY